ncbi:MAG: N-acetyltransferase [Anaerolineae bacterium]|nr:N-acetyltransferase [Anaerolineae bacterium]
MSHPYTLRVATEDDYDFLYALHVATIRAAVEATWGWDEAFQAQRFRDHFVASANQIIVVDGQDAGVFKLEERDGDCFLGLIEILPAYQNRGLGSQVIGDVVAGAFARGRAVSLHVLKANQAARRLYERLGFGIAEERAERYVMRLAPPADAEE